jgi:glycosyltransferase involved in cell wall biosynthesis
MKIALLSEKYTPDIGGLAISTERLARLLASVGHDVRVFCPSPNLLPSEKRTLTSNGVRVTRFGTRKRVDDTLVDWFEIIVEEHRREPFDVLHAYFLTQAGFVATYAGKYLKVPSVVSIRGNDIERAAFDSARFSHTLYALQNASAVTTNASELVKKARAFFDRDIILIPNGIDTDHFKPLEQISRLLQTMRLIPPEASGLPSYFGMKQTSPFQLTVGFVGELREKKGLKVLLPAFAQVNQKRPTTLLIVGVVRQGEDKQFFDEFFTLHPNLQIFVTGFISPGDLPHYYSLLDVFVHPSLRDGLPNALLEAMACERPVVATPVGGVLDVVKDSENGLIVPANDAESLSNAILKLLEDQPLRNRLGKAARETIQKEFTLQKELDLNLKLYRTLGLKD